MDYIVLTGAKPYDGRYELDLEGAGFTTLEWGWIKRLSGYLPMTIGEGFRGADAELFAVLAVIAMHRAGKIAEGEVADVFQKLARLPFDETILTETDGDDELDDEGDADPRAGRSSESSSSSSDTPGADSRTSSERSESDPLPSGIQDWVTLGSDRPMSAA